jgi:hypothetical protein
VELELYEERKSNSTGFLKESLTRLRKVATEYESEPVAFVSNASRGCIKFEAFTATECSESFSGEQSCKYRLNFQRMKNFSCLHHEIHSILTLLIVQQYFITSQILHICTAILKEQ